MKRITSHSVLADLVPSIIGRSDFAACHSHAAPHPNKSGRNPQRLAYSELSDFVDKSQRAPLLTPSFEKIPFFLLAISQLTLQL